MKLKNLLSRDVGTDHPSEANRVYTVPYMIDMAGSIPGIRIHWPTVKANDRNMQMVMNANNGLTLGTATLPGGKMTTTIGRKYALTDLEDDEELSMLGVSLQWKGEDDGGDDTVVASDNDSLVRRRAAKATTTTTSTTTTGSVDSMTTHLVRGMPYATMEYSGPTALPSITSGLRLATAPLIDGSTKLECAKMILDEKTQKPVYLSPDAPSGTVKSDVLLHFTSSDFTWIVFFSRPVQITCYELPWTQGMVGVLPETMFQMFVTPVSSSSSDDDPLVVRVALADECTTGHSNVAEHCEEKRIMKDADEYLDLLRDNAGVYPKSPVLGIDMSGEDKLKEARYTFDWDVQSFSSNDGVEKEVLMFALPHHQEMLESIDGVSTNKVLSDYCKPTFHGSTCLVKGNTWSLAEKLGERQSFIAERPPTAHAIPDLAKALAYDIKYELEDNLQRAALDTYFSGKILARMGRVLLVAKELQNLADGVEPEIGSYGDDLDEEWYSSSVAAAKKVSLPSEQEFEQALERLKAGVEVWIDGSGEAQFLYDATWGGLVNCGCRYTGMRFFNL
jgi:endoglucanase Acf2